MTCKPENGSGKWLIAATLAALAVIAWGALFLIAPIWQWPDKAAAYLPLQAESQTQTEQVLSGGALLDINTADADALTALPGIGPAKAATIVAYREENGPFETLQDLDEVEGISARMVETWVGLATAGPIESDIH